MIKTIALDDNLIVLSKIQEYCGRLDFIRLEKAFNEPGEASKHLNQFPVDLLLLPTHLPSVSGIKFSETISQDIMIIFMSPHEQYAVEAFNLRAVDYLLKPFSFERFSQAAKKAEEFSKLLHQKQNSEQHHLFVRADYSLVKIAVNDILYIEALDDYLKIHISNQETVISKMTMKSILEKLQPEEFIRVHRSFIVPIRRINKIRKRIISLAGIDIPIGLSYQKEFKNIFSVFAGLSMI